MFFSCYLFPFKSKYLLKIILINILNLGSCVMRKTKFISHIRHSLHATHLDVGRTCMQVTQKPWDPEFRMAVP
jgi:hypothetical protein